MELEPIYEKNADPIYHMVCHSIMQLPLQQMSEGERKETWIILSYMARMTIFLGAFRVGEG
jgi:hypothetical protein